MTRSIAVTDIAVEPGIQPRRDGLDAMHVATLVEAGPETWPPLVVVERDGAYLLVDGHHRLGAARRLERADITCEVRSGSDINDLHALTFELNKLHGKPLTLADRKAEAERFLRSNVDISNNGLARRCGLSDKTVAVIREGLEATSEITKSSRRVGADGKTRPATQHRSTSSKSGSTSTKPARAKAGTNGKSQVAESSESALKAEPSMTALWNLIDHVRKYLARYAGDEVGNLLADAVLEQEADSDHRETVEAMRTLGKQLTAAAERLKRLDSAAPVTVETEQAA